MIGKNSVLDCSSTLWSKSKYFRPQPLGRRGNDNYVKELKLYCQLINGFMANLEKAVLDGHTVILPAYMGRVFIQGIKLTIPHWNGAAILAHRRETGETIPIRFSPEKDEGYHYKLAYSFNGGYSYTQWFTVKASNRFKHELRKRLDAGQTYYIKTHYSKRQDFIDKNKKDEQTNKPLFDLSITEDKW